MELEDQLVSDVRWSLDGTTMYVTLSTGVEIEYHGRETKQIVLLVHKRPFKKRTTRTFTLHCETGPARISRRGRRIHRMWYLEGRRMSEAAWTKIINKDVTMSDLMHEQNADIRMLLLKAMGPDKIVEMAKEINRSQDECGRPRILWEYIEPPANTWSQPLRIRFVEVYNSSPPYERFLLYVPPTIETADAAVEWTFPGLPEGYAYNPDVSS